MWTREYSKFYPSVKPEDIWKTWIDIDNWPKWHTDLDYCKLEGEFKAGNHFILKPKKVNAVKVTLTEVNDGQNFTDCTTFPGAKMYNTNSVEAKDNGVLLSNRVVVTGPLRWLWIKLIVKNVADTVPNEVDSLVQLCYKKIKIYD